MTAMYFFATFTPYLLFSMKEYYDNSMWNNSREFFQSDGVYLQSLNSSLLFKIAVCDAFYCSAYEEAVLLVDCIRNFKLKLSYQLFFFF